MTPIGYQYGQALYALAKDEGLSLPILQELAALRQSFAQCPEYIRLLSSPALTKSERCQILDEGFRGEIQPYCLNFLKLMTEKGYMGHFDQACQAYTELYNRDNGILLVKAITAYALSQDQSQRLQEKLAQMTGKTIDLTNLVDPDCLGGVRLEYDGKCTDDTIAHRLENIGKLLKNTVI